MAVFAGTSQRSKWQLVSWAWTRSLDVPRALGALEDPDHMAIFRWPLRRLHMPAGRENNTVTWKPGNKLELVKKFVLFVVMLL